MLEIFKNAGWKSYNDGEVVMKKVVLTDKLKEKLINDGIKVWTFDNVKKIEFDIKKGKTNANNTIYELTISTVNPEYGYAEKGLFNDFDISDLPPKAIDTLAEDPVRYLEYYILP